jgi:hypothetical protein
MAADSNDPRVFRDLLREARRHGDPKLIDYLTFLQVWLVPSGVRRVVRDFVLGRRSRRAARRTEPSREDARTATR